jgi:hypothetical protein
MTGQPTSMAWSMTLQIFSACVSFQGGWLSVALCPWEPYRQTAAKDGEVLAENHDGAAVDGALTGHHTCWKLN